MVWDFREKEPAGEFSDLENEVIATILETLPVLIEQTAELIANRLSDDDYIYNLSYKWFDIASLIESVPTIREAQKQKRQISVIKSTIDELRLFIDQGIVIPERRGITGE